MTEAELLEKVRRVEVRTNRLVNDMMVGAYLSHFKGRGMDFEELRQYIPGDDVRNIDWNAVQARYDDAAKVKPPKPLEQKLFADLPSISPEEVRQMLDAGTPVQIIDTRPRHYSTKAQDMMEGAVWRDPERLDDWIGELSKTEPVVTFCVYGFHIGCETAATLRKQGFDARFMAGGHFAWKAIKGPVNTNSAGANLILGLVSILF